MRDAMSYPIPLKRMHAVSTGVTLLKMNSECLSGDTLLANTESLSDCADACRDTAGCQYFIYGKSKNAKRCYWENTKDASCPEGFKTGVSGGLGWT